MWTSFLLSVILHNYWKWKEAIFPSILLLTYLGNSLMIFDQEISWVTITFGSNKVSAFINWERFLWNWKFWNISGRSCCLSSTKNISGPSYHLVSILPWVQLLKGQGWGGQAMEGIHGRYPNQGKKKKLQLYDKLKAPPLITHRCEKRRRRKKHFC